MKTYLSSSIFWFVIVVGFIGAVTMTGGRQKVTDVRRFLNEQVMNGEEQTTFRDVINFDVMRQYNSVSNSMYRYVISDITSVESQVVQGMVYFVHAKTVPTGCRKNIEGWATSIEECRVEEENGSPEFIEFTLWVRGWLKDPKERLQITVKTPVDKQDNHVDKQDRDVIFY